MPLNTTLVDSRMRGHLISKSLSVNNLAHYLCVSDFVVHQETAELAVAYMQRLKSSCSGGYATTATVEAATRHDSFPYLNCSRATSGWCSVGHPPSTAIASGSTRSPVNT